MAPALTGGAVERVPNKIPLSIAFTPGVSASAYYERAKGGDNAMAESFVEQAAERRRMVAVDAGADFELGRPS